MFKSSRAAPARPSILAGLLTLGLIVAAGCGRDEPRPEAAGGPVAIPYRVVCTTGMVADIVRNVAGDRAEVVALIGEGVDPHLYKPTRSDIASIMAADIAFYNGLLLEGKMTDVLIRAAASLPVVAVTQRIDEQYLLEPEEFEGHFDPHVWMDSTAWARAVEVVRDELSRFDPDGAERYAANAAGYTRKLEELDEYARRVLATVPESSRILITAHDAFNYFGRRYGFRVLGIQGLSTESEAGVRDVSRLVDLIVQRRIRAVFVETTVPDRNVRALIEGARARGHEVAIGGELFSDAMGAPGTYRGTYIGMIDHNVTTIARALGGEAPEGGMSGELGPTDAGSESRADEKR